MRREWEDIDLWSMIKSKRMYKIDMFNLSSKAKIISLLKLSQLIYSRRLINNFNFKLHRKSRDFMI